MSGCNQSDGVIVDPEREWRRYEKLSPAMRRLLMYAPYDYVAPPPTQTVEGSKAFIFADRDLDILKTYGPDHPQIGSRTPERRRR